MSSTRTIRSFIRRYLLSEEKYVPDDILALCFLNGCFPSDLEDLRRNDLLDETEPTPELVCTISSIIIEESQRIDEEEEKKHE